MFCHRRACFPEISLLPLEHEGCLSSTAEQFIIFIFLTSAFIKNFLKDDDKESICCRFKGLLPMQEAVV